MPKVLKCCAWLHFFTILLLQPVETTDVSVSLELLQGEQKLVENGLLIDFANHYLNYGLDFTKLTISATGSVAKESTLDIVIGCGSEPGMKSDGCCEGYACCTGSEYSLLDTDRNGGGGQKCRLGHLGQTVPPMRNLELDVKEHYSVTLSTNFANRPVVGRGNSFPPILRMEGHNFWIIVSNCNQHNVTLFLGGAITIIRKTPRLLQLSRRERQTLVAACFVVSLGYFLLCAWQLSHVLKSSEGFKPHWTLLFTVFLGLIQSLVLVGFKISNEIRWFRAFLLLRLMDNTLLRGLGVWLCTARPSKYHTYSIIFASVATLLLQHFVAAQIKQITAYIFLLWFLWATVALFRSHDPDLLVPKKRLRFLLLMAFFAYPLLKWIEASCGHGQKACNTGFLEYYHLGTLCVSFAFQVALVAFLKPERRSEIEYISVGTEENIELETVSCDDDDEILASEAED